MGEVWLQERGSAFMNFAETREKLWERKRRNGVLIAAHRGTCGGVIVRNTIPAYENALKHESDIVEVDVIRSTDGTFFTFHDGNESRVLGISRDIRKMNSREIEACQCWNDDKTMINQKVERLDDVLEYLRGKCLINIDRSWFYWPETIAELKKYGMDDQIVLKSYADASLLQALEDSRADFMYMPIVNSKADIDLVLKYKINVIGVELIFSDLGSELIQPHYLAMLRSMGLLAWVNAITLDDNTILSGGLDDRISIIGHEDNGWGKLLEMGFDIIQTDWPLLLKKYVNSRKAVLHNRTFQEEGQ